MFRRAFERIRSKYPELDLLPDHDQRLTAWINAERGSTWSPAELFFYGLELVTMGATVAAIKMSGFRLLDLTEGATVLIFAALAVLAVELTIGKARRRCHDAAVRRSIRSQLRRQGLVGSSDN